jgi:hypothetical protein
VPSDQAIQRLAISGLCPANQIGIQLIVVK